MHKKFEINRTKIKASCQWGRKLVTNDSKSDLPLDRSYSNPGAVASTKCNSKMMQICVCVALSQHLKIWLRRNSLRKTTRKNEFFDKAANTSMENCVNCVSQRMKFDNMLPAAPMKNTQTYVHRYFCYL